MHGIDIKEDYIKGLGHKLLETLLIDRTTGENIIWATDDYSYLGSQYTFFAHIFPENITGEYKNLIQPRAAKTMDEKKKRARKMAEVFTPSWLCNAMNNGVDERMFKRENVFNVEYENGKEHLWLPTKEKIAFPDDMTWQQYVKSIILEITCGEAPFLVSRYDVVSGKPFTELDMRIGWLDRKLRIVNENVQTKEEWLHWTKEAYKATIGYEWQGDNLLLARENMLFTLYDYYENRFGEEPSLDYVCEIAEIISWNIWQMDGLKFVIPRSCHTRIEETTDILTGEIHQKEIPCTGCKKNLPHNHNGIYSLIMDWEKGHPIRFDSLLTQKKESNGCRDNK